MCHQTVGLVAGSIERRGIPTTSISLLKEITEKVRTPRALFVARPLGYPLGRPRDPELQASIVARALALLDAPGPPPVLADFADGPDPAGPTSNAGVA